MATLKQIIERVDSVKPNAFTVEEKLEELNALEGRIALEVFLMAPVEAERFRYAWPEDQDVAPLVKPPYDNIYPLWLESRIDAMNGEYNRYSDSMAIFNDAWSDFACWFAQRYDPAEGYIPEERRLPRKPHPSAFD